MKEQILKTISVISVSALTIVGISYAQAWTGNTSTAPANNAPAPINVGSSSQIKGGGLSLGSLIVSGGVQLTSGAGAGKVLTSDASGNVSWQAASGTEILFDSKINVPIDDTLTGYTDDYIVAAGTTYGGQQIPANAKSLLVYAVIDDKYPASSSNSLSYKWSGQSWRRFMIANGGDEQSVLSWLPLDSQGKIEFRFYSAGNNNSFDNLALEIHGYRN